MHKIFTKPLFLGKKVISLPHCHSTNEIAMTLAGKPDTPQGTIIITDHQTKGKGQRGNSWISAPGQNLTFSVILQPKFLYAKDHFGLTMMVSLGLYDLLDPLVDNVKIKWPNDLYVLDKKIAGILIETTVRSATIDRGVLGIGLNVNQAIFPLETPTSLYLETGTIFELAPICENLLVALEKWYLVLKNQGIGGLRQPYLSNLYWMNQKRTFRDANHEFIGIIKGVDNFGRLIVESGGTQKSYGLKEITFIR